MVTWGGSAGEARTDRDHTWRLRSRVVAKSGCSTSGSP